MIDKKTNSESTELCEAIVEGMKENMFSFIPSTIASQSSVDSEFVFLSIINYDNTKLTD